MGTTNVCALVALLVSLFYTSTAVPTPAPTAVPPPKVLYKESTLSPNGKAIVYQYSASVASGQNEPAPFASKFELRGKLIYTTEPYLIHLSFRDLVYSMHNGRDNGQTYAKFLPLENDDIYKSFTITHSLDNIVQKVKIEPSEAEWSKNIKKSVASLFRVDRKINETSESYNQREKNTNYGDCDVNFSVRKYDGETVVQKAYEPVSCSHYFYHVITDHKPEFCDADAEEDVASIAKKVFTYGPFEGIKNELLKRVDSHEKWSYLPWAHRNYGIQFIETNQTLVFEKVSDKTEFNLITNNGSEEIFSFNQTQPFSFEIMEQEAAVAKAKKLLVDMVDFLKENRVNVKELNSEHKYLMEDLYTHLSVMDAKSLRYVHEHFTKTEKGQMARKIFLKTIPYVSTEAVWKFVLHIVDVENPESPQLLDEDEKLDILRKLPLHVSNPTPRLLDIAASYKSLGVNSYRVNGAGVLCYSILINQVLKSSGRPEISQIIDEISKEWYDRIRYENTYNNKVLYMMALKNIGWHAYEHLIPIIKGEDIFYVDVMIEKREKYQIAAMWAASQSIYKYKPVLAYELFWPILSNTSMPLTMRITAYELLVSRNPNLNMRVLMQVHEMMTNERDEHLFNYHYTTLKSNSESTSPCMERKVEHFRKVLRMTKPRRVHSAALSTANVHDYYDTMYGHGKTLKVAAEINEATGIPQSGYFEVISSQMRKPKLTKGYYWNIDGINLNTIVQLVKNIDLASHSYVGITDETIRKILEQTQGHKLFDRHIHVELWTVDNGYVTGVTTYFENALTDLLRDYSNKYKPDFDRLMDVEKKYKIDSLDISFKNHYSMIIKTDLGMPALFSNFVPQISHMILKPVLYPQRNIAMRVELDSKFYRHGVYSMKFLNPIFNITHSVERRIVTDGALPIDVTFSYQMPSQTLKLELPRLDTSAAGLRIKSFDQVVLTEQNLENKLKTHCPTCENRTEISNGLKSKNNDLQVYHQLDSGLEFTYGMFDCEHDFEPHAEMQEWYRIFNSPKNSWKHDIFVTYWMMLDQGMVNYMNNPYASSCGVIMKVATCTLYPVSNVEMNWRASVAKVGSEMKAILRGNVEVNSSKTNETMRNWEIDVSTDYSHYLSGFAAKLTRKIPDEKNLKVCFEAVKAYPKLVPDVSEIEYKTHSKVIFKMGHSDSDECATDAIDFKAVITGERLEEQIEEMKNYVKPDSCFRNASNPLDIDVTKPVDWNCFYQSVKATTMRKYTVDITYGEMPTKYSSELRRIEDWMRSTSWPQITYRTEHTEKGHANIYVTYPASKNYGNLTFVNPHYTWELIDVVYEPEEVDTRPNDIAFDNIFFPATFLADFYKDDIRPCIAHAHELINDMNQTIPMEFKDWTLMSGDHGLMSYAVFVKTVADDKLAVRVHVPDHVLEVSPGESKPVINLDGSVIPYDQEIVLPAFDAMNYKVSFGITKFIVIETERYSKVKVYYSPHNVVVLPHIAFDRNVDGVCGHMGTTVYTQTVPLVYGSA